MENNLHAGQPTLTGSNDNMAPASSTWQKRHFLRDILVGLVSLLFGVFLGIYLSRFIPISDNKKTQDISSTISPEPTNINQHYVLKDGTSSLDYPPGWTITDNTQEISNPYTNKLEWIQDVSLKKGDYSLTSKFSIEPHGCNFSDTPEEYVDVTGDQFDDFSETTINGLKYRKSKIMTEENTYFWRICSDYSFKYQGTYTSRAGFGHVAYGTPIKYDENILSEMDQIMASMRTK
jgi:hypothetical protein